jgi:NTE family protein
MAAKTNGKAPRRVSLALQGGGSHGAFTWGALDRLLDEPDIEIAGVCGTSAGAMNGTVLVHGLASGGRARAQELLALFWKRVSEGASAGLLQPSPLDKMMSRGNMEMSPVYWMFTSLSRIASPYQLNPTNANPLRDVLESVVDFERLRHAESGAVPLFVCATNVLTGRIKVFERKDVSADAVMASACLPGVFQAVEVDGQHYWDGGFMGNPPIYPLIYHVDTRDVIIIQINPIAIAEVPKTAADIDDRVKTLSWNSSMMREMRAIHFVTSLIDKGFDDGGRLKRMLLHVIDAEEELGKFRASSKLNADWDWVCHLRDLGRSRADRFLAEHGAKIGKESSVDIVAKFL